MRLLTGIFLVCCTALFSAAKEKDLTAIVEKSYLDTQCAPFLTMMAQKAIGSSQKKIEAEKLVDLFRKEMRKEEVLKKFFASYETVFSKTEIHKLRTMLESPVWQKFMHEGTTIAQSHIALIDGLFEELANNCEGEKRAESALLQVTQENFKELIASDKPIILDIKAEWCPPCKMMEPILEDLCEKYQGQIQFGKVDFDTQKELAKEFDVSSLPTLLFIKPGEKEPSIKNIGFLKKEDLEGKIGEFLDSLK